MNANRAVETFERNFAKISKRQALADAKLGDDIRNESLVGLRARAESRGELNGRSEKIAVAFDRFAGRGADAHQHWELPVARRML